MTEHRRETVLRATGCVACVALALTGAVLQGCAPTPQASRLRVYAVDMTGGAKSCDVPQITPVSGKATEAEIKIGNDGGWCGLPVSQPGQKPFDAGLLTERPAHGAILIHQVGDVTRIDYTPDRGFAGSDSFTVKLLPGDATIHVSATISRPT